MSSISNDSIDDGISILLFIIFIFVHIILLFGALCLPIYYFIYDLDTFFKFGKCMRILMLTFFIVTFAWIHAMFENNFKSPLDVLKDLSTVKNINLVEITVFFFILNADMLFFIYVTIVNSFKESITNSYNVSDTYSDDDCAFI